MKKIILILLGYLITLNANLISDTVNEQNININANSFKILEFSKMIESIKVSNKKSLEIEFIDDENKPLQKIKLLSKENGKVKVLISFFDNTILNLNINIQKDLNQLITLVNEISPKLNIKQINKKIVLTGKIKNQKFKKQIYDLFKKAGLNLEEDLIDLSTLQNPSKMIKVKLYAVEINNDKGLDLKNNWTVSSKNYMKVVTPDGLYYNEPMDASSNNDYNNANNQRNVLVNDAVDQMMANAVSLSGGLTGAANYLGRLFNVGFTLNYLSSKGVANVLDETTLLTLENKDATFHAGGTIYTKVQTTTDQGVPRTDLKEIDYGLKLDIKAKNVINERFIDLEITTKSTGVDWANQVDGIPSFTEKSIVTNVISKNGSTIVLGGLINRQDSNDIKKIPILGDIPILGFLFRSKAFKEGKSELVFFITPEVVDPQTYDESEHLSKKTLFAKRIDKKYEVEKKPSKKIKKVEKIKVMKKTKKELNQEEEHQKRVKEILGL